MGRSITDVPKDRILQEKPEKFVQKPSSPTNTGIDGLSQEKLPASWFVQEIEKK